MRWEDERYVRLYTRDTATWKLLPWQSKALLPLLMRKLDRAGVMDLGDEGLEAISVMVELPWEVVEPGLQGLLRKGVFVESGSALVMPNFLDAQEVPISDAQRKREQRERERARRVSPESHVIAKGVSRDVTSGHAQSQSVTPNRAVPSCAVPNRTEEARALGKPDTTIPDINLHRMSQSQDAAFSWLKFHDAARVKAFPRALQDPPESGSFLHWYRAATGLVPDAKLREAYSAFLRDPWASKLNPPCPWDAWAKKWRGFVPNQTGGPPRNIPKPLKPGEVEHA